ncbi:MAG TPA: hypothetical protein VJR89_27375 [Polyangiales bacterium]|nr:hypothetical protein [Polyangiales bacterium]
MERSTRTSLPSTIPVDAGTMSGAVLLLAQLESLPPDASGVLLFGSEGVVLVESRKVCWAAAPGMGRRLNKLLLQQRNPPLEEGYVDRVLRDCQFTGRPLGEALLAAGDITADGLRAALFHHILESIARIAHSGVRCEGFTPHAGRGYDPRFAFSTAEILIALGARRDSALAAAARQRLTHSLPPDARGLAFVRDAVGPVAMAIEGDPTFRVPEIVDMCAWATGLFEAAAIVDEDIRIATGTSGDSNGVVTWRVAELQFVAVCPNRAASAMLMARLNEGMGADS